MAISLASIDRGPRPLRAAGLLALLLGAAACARLVPSRVVTDDLRAADAERIAAMVDADPVRLDAMLDDTLTYAHSNGRVDSKRDLIDALVLQRIDYRVVDVGERRARRFGDVGIVTAPVRMEVAAGGRVHRLRGVYTAVYWWRDGGWRLVAYHSSPHE